MRLYIVLVFLVLLISCSSTEAFDFGKVGSSVNKVAGVVGLEGITGMVTKTLTSGEAIVAEAVAVAKKSPEYAAQTTAADKYKTVRMAAAHALCSSGIAKSQTFQFKLAEKFFKNAVLLEKPYLNESKGTNCIGKLDKFDGSSPNGIPKAARNFLKKMAVKMTKMLDSGENIPLDWPMENFMLVN